MDFVTSFADKAYKFFVRYNRQVVVALLCAFGVGAGSGTYFWYRLRVEQQAHKAYAQVRELVSAKVVEGRHQGSAFEKVFATQEEKWQAIADRYAAVHKKFSHTSIGTIAAAAQANALIHIGKTDEARTLFASFYDTVNAGAVKSMYTVTYALLLLDSTEKDQTVREAHVAQGLALLETTAANTNNPAHDLALYHLGLYNWHNKEFTKAVNYWQQLLLHYDKPGNHKSPWVAHVKDKLALLEVE